MDVVDFDIKGSEMQFVEVELDPGEAAVGEAGSLMFMDAGIGMDTVFGDGSAGQGGFLGKLFGAGKRLITGESLFTTVYTNNGAGKQRVRIAADTTHRLGDYWTLDNILVSATHTHSSSASNSRARCSMRRSSSTPRAAKTTGGEGK